MYMGTLKIFTFYQYCILQFNLVIFSIAILIIKVMMEMDCVNLEHWKTLANFCQVLKTAKKPFMSVISIMKSMMVKMAQSVHACSLNL